MASVRFTTAEDGVSLAWTRSGSGPPLVKVATWLTHLEYDAESPVWSHHLAFYERNFDYLRYDERGCGLSDHETGRLDLETWTSDLRRVIEAADMPRPFALLAMSQGTGPAVAYAAKYPDEVSALYICGGYARGADCRNDPAGAALYHAVVEVLSRGFNEKNPAFRDVFTSRFVPDGDPERVRWCSELVRKSTTPETSATLMAARAAMDASEYLPHVKCPTVVFHPADDTVVPLSEGRFLAQRIPGAEFVTLPSANHILQEEEPAWSIYCDTLLRSAGVEATTPDLTPREQAIMDLLAQGLSNKAIARELDVSEKTVRNHATHIFAKLGVSNRAEAIVKVRR